MLETGFDFQGVLHVVQTFSGPQLCHIRVDWYGCNQHHGPPYEGMPWEWLRAAAMSGAEK